MFLPQAELQWSLYGVPEQIERDATQEHYWEVRRFLVLAASEPERAGVPLLPARRIGDAAGKELLAMREVFLSRLVTGPTADTSFRSSRRCEADLRNRGAVKWKHVMHLIRLLIAGIRVLQEGRVPIRVEEHRDQLLAIRRGELPWDETERWRRSLHAEFDTVLTQSTLPERPDYEQANAPFLSGPPGRSSGDPAMTIDPRLLRRVDEHPYPLLFATISGAHLYGFPSPDSDFDLRGAHHCRWRRSWVS